MFSSPTGGATEDAVRRECLAAAEVNMFYEKVYASCVEG
jgi:hypothetical protein